MSADVIAPWSGMIHNTALVRRSKDMLRRAGYDPEELTEANGGAFRAEFEVLMRTLTYIAHHKVDDYGDFRLQDIRSWDREIWGAYWDIQRKFGRLENQLQLTNPNLDDLLETLADQAVYCVRMMQILRRLEEKGMIPK